MICSAASIFGARMLGRAHLRALSHRLHLPRVAEAYAEALGSELGFPVELVRLEKWELAAHNADIVVTVTAGDQPAVEGASLRSGAFVARLGSYQEVAFDVITGADKVVVDPLALREPAHP